MGYRGLVEFDESAATYTVTNGSVDGTSCVKVDCPANSTEIGSSVGGSYFPACKCGTGFTGVLSWSTDSNTWGVCTPIACPLHSHGHPNCACDSGYGGAIVWDNYDFQGTCQELATAPTWGSVPQANIADASCSRVRGALGSAASVSSNGVLTFTFAGDNSTVSTLRCDIKLDRDFSKVKGQLSLVPIEQTGAMNNFLQQPAATVKYPQNNFEILQWNPVDATASSSYIAFGTPFSVVDPGMEMGTSSKSYSSESTIALPESSVASSDTLRIEAQQKPGVTFELRFVDMQTYNLPVDVIKCSREVSGSSTVASK